MTTSPILSGVGGFLGVLISLFPIFLDVYNFIEYVSILLIIGYDNVLIYADCDEIYIVEFSC